MNTPNVLVPVDFSPASRFALDCAVSLARKMRARLTLLHVVEFPSTLPYVYPPEDEEAKRRQCDEALNQLTSLLGPEDQDDLDLQLRIRHGDIKEEIRSAIWDEHASMVVMGTHSLGFVERLLIGSVTLDLLRKIPVPVVTVSHDAHPMHFARVLFATGLSESYREEFEFVLNFARMTAAELLIFHSVEPLNVDYSGELPKSDAQAKLAILEAECARHNVRVRTELGAGPVAERILAAAEASASEMIILTIQDKGAVERVFLGSTAERIVRESSVPVLSVPAHFEASRDHALERQSVRQLGHSAILFDV